MAEMAEMADSRAAWLLTAAALALVSTCSGRLSRSRAATLEPSAPGDEGSSLTMAIRDIALGLPTSHVNFLFDSLSGDAGFPARMIKEMHESEITTTVYVVDSEKGREKFCEYTKECLSKYVDSVNIIFSARATALDLFWMIQQRDLIHRRLLYIFYWGHQSPEGSFTTAHIEAMRVVLITNPRPGIYRVYYSQAEASGNNELTLVNWWSADSGLFRRPVLLPAEKVYEDFKGRVFEIPVLHKPPWNFVEYGNDSFRVDGGRDDKLLAVLADKLNFRYRYVDPPHRIQGSAMTENGTFPGVLGQVWQRDYDFFMGDVTVTYERSRAVEFSFFTLVDSEAFVTHRPGQLNEAFALIRPFRWQVWPPIVVTILLYGPILFAIIEASHLLEKKRRTSEERLKLLDDCLWFGTATFLRQGGTQPGNSHKVRLVLTLTTLGATYVIGDMYSANLTSLLARPGREKPITVLEELEEAMYARGYELLVEKHSSFFGILQNGTGLHKRLWDKMQTQNQSVIDSVEMGMKLVRGRKKFAVLGGRETLHFDSKRFGSHNFQLSEKLNTRYSAIAMQFGCPYAENFNRILMQLFEAGILMKMTEEEYEKLGEKQRAAAAPVENDEEVAQVQKRKQEESMDSQAQVEQSNGKTNHLKAEGNEKYLRSLNIRMLQGAFYSLMIGYAFSGIVLILEKNAGNMKKMLVKRRCTKCRTFVNVYNWKR